VSECISTVDLRLMHLLRRLAVDWRATHVRPAPLQILRALHGLLLACRVRYVHGARTLLLLLLGLNFALVKGLVLPHLLFHNVLHYASVELLALILPHLVQLLRVVRDHLRRLVRDQRRPIMLQRWLAGAKGVHVAMLGHRRLVRHGVIFTASLLSLLTRGECLLYLYRVLVDD